MLHYGSQNDQLTRGVPPPSHRQLASSANFPNFINPLKSRPNLGAIHRWATNWTRFFRPQFFWLKKHRAFCLRTQQVLPKKTQFIPTPKTSSRHLNSQKLKKFKVFIVFMFYTSKFTDTIWRTHNEFEQKKKQKQSGDQERGARRKRQRKEE